MNMEAKRGLSLLVSKQEAKSWTSKGEGAEMRCDFGTKRECSTSTSPTDENGGVERTSLGRTDSLVCEVDFGRSGGVSVGCAVCALSVCTRCGAVPTQLCCYVWCLSLLHSINRTPSGSVSVYCHWGWCSWRRGLRPAAWWERRTLQTAVPPGHRQPEPGAVQSTAFLSPWANEESVMPTRTWIHWVVSCVSSQSLHGGGLPSSSALVGAVKKHQKAHGLTRSKHHEHTIPEPPPHCELPHGPENILYPTPKLPNLNSQHKFLCSYV